MNINYGLKWLGNEVKDWVVSPRKVIKVLLKTSDNMKEWMSNNDNDDNNNNNNNNNNNKYEKNFIDNNANY